MTMSWRCPECGGVGKVFDQLDGVEDCSKCHGLGYTTTPPSRPPGAIDHREDDDE